MAVAYKQWDGEEFSTSWYWIIRKAVKDGILKISDINDAHRSWALQEQRVREHGVWSNSNPTGAARPSHTAPHIWTGHENHALDVQTWAILKLMSWLGRHGVSATRPISTEPWHLWVADEAALIAFGKRCYEELREPRFTKLEKRLMKRKLTKATRLALKTQAALIQRAARRRGKKGGWSKFDREKRFQALRKRALSA